MKVSVSNIYEWSTKADCERERERERERETLVNEKVEITRSGIRRRQNKYIIPDVVRSKITASVVVRSQTKKGNRQFFKDSINIRT